MRLTVLSLTILAGSLAGMVPAYAASSVDPIHCSTNPPASGSEQPSPAAARAAGASPTEARTAGVQPSNDIAPVGAGWG